MLLNYAGASKLFAKSVPISIKDSFTNQIRTSKLFLTIEWQDASSAIYKKELVVSLTDNDDPFFLYNLHLSEDDFQILKANQGLLVDFTAFPQKFIELIELCLHEQNKVEPKFILIFNINEKLGNISSPSHLDVVETNPFKHLTHLSLKFVLATETSVKQYLVSCFKQLKEEKQQLQNRLTYVEKDFKDRLNACEENLNSKIQELEIVKKELNVEISVKESKHASELQAEREKYYLKQKDEELRHEKEKKDKAQNFRRQIQQLESRVTCLDTLNKELQDKNYKNDSVIRDLRSKVLSLEDEIRRTQENFQNCKYQKDNLESETKYMNRLKDKINELEEELNSKKLLVQKQVEEVRNYESQKRNWEADIENLKAQLRANEKTQESMKVEVITSNKVITVLQKEAQDCHDKILSYNNLYLKQKKSSLEKEKMVESLKNKLSKESQMLQSQNDKIKNLLERVQTLTEKLSLIEKESKAKDHLIKWLNKQMTDHCVVPHYTLPSNFITSPSNQDEGLKQNVNADTPKASNSKAAPKCGPLKPLFREEYQSPLFKMGENSSLPSRIPEAAIDSAYGTSPSGDTDKNLDALTKSPIFADGEPNFELDQSALSAAFGSGHHIIKHSTAKKQSHFKPTTKKK